MSRNCIGQVIEPDAGRSISFNALYQLGFDLLKKILLGQADTLNEATVAYRLTIYANRDQLRIAIEICPECSHFHTGVQPVPLAQLEEALVETVKPQRISAGFFDSADNPGCDFTIGPAKRREMGG